MNCLPIILRELREESRRKNNYYLRAMGAAASLVILFAILMQQRLPPALIGHTILYSQNVLLFVMIFTLGPLITADCLSREKREGTLGLLFLTPLTSLGIATGKSFAHGLRAVIIFIGLVPAFSVAFLFGGIAWQDVAMVCLTDSCALLVALSAGLLASACTKDAIRNLVTAEILGLVFCWIFMMFNAILYAKLNFAVGVAATPRPGWSPQYYNAAYFFSVHLRQNDEFFGLPTLLLFNTGLYPEDYYGVLFSWRNTWSHQPPAFVAAWFQAMCWRLGYSFLFLMGCLALAAWQLRQACQEQPPRPQQVWLEQTFCTPRFARFLFRQKMSRLLNQNPIGWLQQYSWTARSARWGLCLFMTLVACSVFGTSHIQSWGTMVAWMTQFLLLAMTFSTAGSFRREKESGALELLLVTPLSTLQIVLGRIRGLWRQYLPAAAILALCILTLLNIKLDRMDELCVWILGAADYFLIPVFGLYFSLLQWPFIASWLIISTYSFIPFWLILAANSHGSNLAPPFYLLLVALIFQTCLALAMAVKLVFRLKKRKFLF